MKFYLGIDPGLHGALALIDDLGRFYALADMPIKYKYDNDKNTKRIIDAKKLEELIIRFICEYGVEDLLVVLEDVHGVGGWSASVSFSLGETIGAIRAVVDSFAYPIQLITPTFWKKYFKLTSDKEVVRAFAIKMFRDAECYLDRKKDHDRAEALLIARYAMEICNK